MAARTEVGDAVKSLPLWKVSDKSRPIDWRWQVALAFTNKQIADHQVDDYDGVTQKLMRFHKRYTELKQNRGTNQKKLLEFDKRHEDYYFAMALAKRNDAFRHMIDAFLFTDEPLDGVARAFSIEESQLQTYHDVFFDIRDRLGSRGYIFGLIDALAGSGVGDTHAHMNWKLVAFEQGAEMLRVVMNRASDISDNAHKRMVRNARHLVEFNFWMAAMNPDFQPERVMERTQAAQVQRTADIQAKYTNARDEDEEQLKGGAKVMAVAVDASVSSNVRECRRQLDGGSRELRAHEETTVFLQNAGFLAKTEQPNAETAVPVEGAKSS